MKKKYKTTDKDLRKIFGKSKPALCPECGKSYGYFQSLVGLTRAITSTSVLNALE